MASGATCRTSRAWIWSTASTGARVSTGRLIMPDISGPHQRWEESRQLLDLLPKRRHNNSVCRLSFGNRDHSGSLEMKRTSMQRRLLILMLVVLNVGLMSIHLFAEDDQLTKTLEIGQPAPAFNLP